MSCRRDFEDKCRREQLKPNQLLKVWRDSWIMRGGRYAFENGKFVDGRYFKDSFEYYVPQWFMPFLNLETFTAGNCIRTRSFNEFLLKRLLSFGRAL